LFSGITQNVEGIYFTIGAVLCEILNGIEKKAFKKIFNKYDFIYRPKGAVQCFNGIICNATKPHTNLGMPSGHSQIVGFLAGYIIYKVLCKENGMTLKQKIYKIKITIATSLLVMILGMLGRLNSNISGSLSADSHGCHTIFQTISGASIGLIFGTLWYMLYNLIIDFYNRK